MHTVKPMIEVEFEKAKRTRWYENIEGWVWAAGIILLIILCAGEPDLLDAIIYRLTDGAFVPASVK